MILNTSEAAVCCSSDSVRSSVALAQLIEQPRVLYGDDGLSGEALHQLDLLVGEFTHLLAINYKGTDEFVLLQHWYDENGPSTGIIHDLGKRWILDVTPFCPDVGNVNDVLRSS